MQNVRLYPGFRNHWNQDYNGKECEAFEQCHGEIGLFSCGFAGEGDSPDMQKEYVGEKQAKADGDKQLA